MTDRVYTTVDKSAWGEGEWSSEPDKVQWTDEETGLPCLAVRNQLGAWCGYAGVADGHPWFAVPYGGADPDADWDSPERPDSHIECHGGLTYSDFCEEGAPEAEGICHVAAPGEPDRVWWFGFDCAHGHDVVPGMEARERAMGFPPIREPYSTYRTLDYVRREVASLARQLAAQQGVAA